MGPALLMLLMVSSLAGCGTTLQEPCWSTMEPFCQVVVSTGDSVEYSNACKVKIVSLYNELDINYRMQKQISAKMVQLEEMCSMAG